MDLKKPSPLDISELSKRIWIASDPSDYNGIFPHRHPQAKVFGTTQYFLKPINSTLVEASRIASPTQNHKRTKQIHNGKLKYEASARQKFEHNLLD